MAAVFNGPTAPGGAGGRVPTAPGGADGRVPTGAAVMWASSAQAVANNSSGIVALTIFRADITAPPWNRMTVQSPGSMGRLKPNFTSLETPRLALVVAIRVTYIVNRL